MPSPRARTRASRRGRRGRSARAPRSRAPPLARRSPRAEKLRPRRNTRNDSGARRSSRATLREPRAGLLVVEGDGVLAALEHDLEVAPADRLLRPPAVDDVPFLPDERDRLPVHRARRPVEGRLDERRSRLVYSSRGTRRARDSGTRDHGETSTTEQTEPEPVLARTWRR